MAPTPVPAVALAPTAVAKVLCAPPILLSAVLFGAQPRLSRRPRPPPSAPHRAGARAAALLAKGGACAVLLASRSGRVVRDGRRGAVIVDTVGADGCVVVRRVPAQRGGAKREAPCHLELVPAGQSPLVQQDHENNAVADAVTSPSGRAILPETHPPNVLGTTYHMCPNLQVAPRLTSNADDNGAVVNQTPGEYS